jgi:hypothetical protein
MRCGLGPVCSAQKEGHMLDIVYLALGLGIFVLMAAYARWAANA